MGWLRTLFLGDIGNRLDIGDNEARIRSVRNSVRRVHREKRKVDATQDAAIQELEARVEQLELTVGMLTSLLVSKGVVSEGELEQLVDRLDPEEG